MKSNYKKTLINNPYQPNIQQSITNIILSTKFITKPIINPYIFFIYSNLQITKKIKFNITK